VILVVIILKLVNKRGKQNILDQASHSNVLLQL